MDQVKIGSFLKELRKERNLTQESLAEKLNVSNRTISRWERGLKRLEIKGGSGMWSGYDDISRNRRLVHTRPQ